jgi:Phage phiEco32-like COOH.NH2 ligase-type 2
MKIGADPEIFLIDAHGALVSAIGKIGGSKENPLPVEELGNGFAIQEDNVAVEYNIPAADSSDELVKNINAMMGYLQTKVGGMGLAFSQQSAVFFPKKQLKDPRALEFGCEPDFNAWTLGVNPRPRADDPTLRSCGGHVHVGCNLNSMEDIAKAVRRMDLALAVPACVLDKDGLLRKQLYGKPGAFRPKPYGFEYRVLSNFWIFKDTHIDWVWKATEKALSLMDTPIENDSELIFNAINNNDEVLAAGLMEKYNLVGV